MPWYYAGPEAKPVGPITLDELQALRARGTIAPDTYVIEQTGQPGSSLAWRKYQDLFPTLPGLPPVPSVQPMPSVQPTPLAPVTPPVVSLPPAVTPPPAPTPHPLFPSATPVGSAPPVFAPAARPDPYYQAQGRRTNAWCGWGLGLGIMGFVLSFVCVGIFPALLAVPCCLVGLWQLSKNREQGGHWFAIWGLVLSTFALVIMLFLSIHVMLPLLKARGLTVTETTTNDSE